MNVEQILNQILSEQESRTAKGINYNDTFAVLDGAIKACEGLSFLKGKTIKQMKPSSPVDESGVPLMNKFEEIHNMRPEAVAYAGGQLGQQFVVVFGVRDPQSQNQALLAYNISQGKKADRMAGGAASGCPQLQKFENYGQANLNEYNQAILQSFLTRYGSMYTVADKSNMSNYKKVPMRDLRQDGKPLNWDGDPQGFVWMKVEGGQTKFADNPEVVVQKMRSQGFTDDQTQVQDSDALMELGFYLKDVAKDLSSFQIDPNMALNKPFWPTKDGGVVVDPTPEQCREFVKLLTACKNNDKNVTSTQCLDKLFQRKLSTIRCNKKNMFRAGGVLGLKDEFESLMTDPGKYGLANLSAALGKVRMGQITAESTLKNRINRVLNEEHKKFNFNNRPNRNIKFDKRLVEDLASKLVLTAYFDLQNSIQQINRLNESTLDLINENVLSDLAGGLGSNLTDKLIQGGKETIAKKIIGYLGFDPNSYISLLLVNIFANLEIKDYGTFLSDCNKFTDIIVKSALEAWLDLAMQKMGGDTMSGFVYSALKNTVTETAANTTVFKKLEKLAESMVCPMISGLKGTLF